MIFEPASGGRLPDLVSNDRARFPEFLRMRRASRFLSRKRRQPVRPQSACAGLTVPVCQIGTSGTAVVVPVRAGIVSVCGVALR